MKILVIYSLHPEQTLFCVIENPTDDELIMLDKACMQMSNVTTDSEGSDWLNEFIAKHNYISVDFYNSDSRSDVKRLLNQSFDKVIWSAYHM